MTTVEVPKSGLADFVLNLARLHKVRHVRSANDELADVVTRLADDAVVTDAIEDLIVELRRSHVIDSATMVSILGNHLEEKKNGCDVQTPFLTGA